MQQPQSTELQICEQMANFKLQNYKFEFLTPQTYTMSQIKKPIVTGKEKEQIGKSWKKDVNDDLLQKHSINWHKKKKKKTNNY